MVHSTLGKFIAALVSGLEKGRLHHLTNLKLIERKSKGFMLQVWREISTLMSMCGEAIKIVNFVI